VNTIELHRSSPHPPDTEDRQVLTIPDSPERARLSVADRFSLRLGLWLIQRSARSVGAPRPTPAQRTAIVERSSLTLSTDIHRQLR
jgi:hypothetical protein